MRRTAHKAAAWFYNGRGFHHDLPSLREDAQAPPAVPVARRAASEEYLEFQRKLAALRAKEVAEPLPDDGPGILEPARNALASEVIQTMATQPNRAPREVVDFPANVPVTVALKYSQGKTVSSQYGERIMFSLTDGRVMFLDPQVAGQIEPLGINVRENFTITRKWDGQKDSPTSWEVARIPGEQPNGTFVVPALPAPAGAASAGAASAGAASEGGNRKPSARAYSLLVDEANSLVDAYAQVLERTLNTYQGRIKPEEARSLLVTAYIQRSKLSSVA